MEDVTSVHVALRIRPQNVREKIDMCQVCTSVMRDVPQVVIGKDRSFTFDYVFEETAPQDTIHNMCIRGLVDGCFEGYNATVFAYGQTGSGKTYTMGTGFDVNIDPSEVGIVPRAVEHLFNGIEDRRRQAFDNGLPPPDFKVNAQFMELYNEEIIDLLDASQDPGTKGRKSLIRIHEDAQGGIYCVGATVRPVQSFDDTIKCLKAGALSRTTGSTNMNVSSSRSHAIFSLHIKQLRMVKEEVIPDLSVLEADKDTESTIPSRPEFETLTAKFHFVDLAGSERLKRTGATGDRAKEGISINCGLLALGNVISALGDQLKKGCHVPYRDSKLTRLLQDSLGGNSRTLMIACISPSDRDFMETLTTLNYANRARNIKNKVVANQDKASLQIATLRSEIQSLQQELFDFKTGRKVVDSDGREGVNDMVKEISMLQLENSRLRSRIKALGEAMLSLKADNAKLIVESATTSLIGEGGHATREDIANQIKKYITEIEDLKVKFAESDAMVKHLGRQAVRTSRSPHHFLSLSHTSTAVEYNAPVSVDAEESSVLSDARRELRHLKRHAKQRQGDQSRIDKENRDRGDHSHGVDNGAGGDLAADVEEMLNDEDEEFGLMDEEGEVDEEGEECSSESDLDSEGGDSDTIHKDLAELTCDISIKHRLIDDLERSQKNMHSMRQHYEEKLQQLQARIRETEVERDTILGSMGKVEALTAEKTKQVRVEYQHKLSSLQLELKKMQVAKKEHAKMVTNNSHTEKQLKTLQHDLLELKKTKVRLMRQLKAESVRSKQTEAKRNREFGKMRSDQLRKENLIKTLEREKHQKETILRRKQEEVETLRRRQKPMSTKAAGRVAKYDRPVTRPMSPISTRRLRNQDSEFSPKIAKCKWERLVKYMDAIVTKKQTIALMERDMEMWLKQREMTIKKLERYQRSRDAAEGQSEGTIMKDAEDVICALQQQVSYAQDNINESQMGIVQVEENRDKAESLDVRQLINSCRVGEAQYLIEHCLQLSIEHGLTIATRDAEWRELKDKLHLTELNNSLQQDLLRHMMQEDVQIESDDLMTHYDDVNSETSSSTPSPVESIWESTSTPVTVAGIVQAVDGTLPVSAGNSQKEKARRRTATPQELLYPMSTNNRSESLGSVLEASEADRTFIIVDDDLGEAASCVSVDKCKTASKSSEKAQRLLMPPPKSLPPRPSGSRSCPSANPSPAMKRKDLGRKTTSNDPSPTLRRRTAPDSNLSCSSSMDSASDTTPPSSPSSMRRGIGKNNEKNVFSRLSARSRPGPECSDRGNIMSVSSVRVSTSNKPPLLVCSHMAKGHSKAVLSVAATDHLLFSASKDRTCKVWDLGTGRELQVLAGHLSTVLLVKHCTYTHCTFTVSQSSIRIWDLRANPATCVRTLSSSGLTSTAAPVSAASSGRFPEVAHHEHSINDLALSQHGSTLYCAAGNVVQVWDLRRYSQVGRLSGHQAQVMVLAIGEGAAGGDTVISGSKDHYIKIFEVMKDAAGILSPRYNLDPPHYDGIQALAVHGRTLFSGSRDMCIKKWDLSTQRLQQSVYSAHKDWICAMEFMPTSSATVLSGCRAGVLKLWSADTCTVLSETQAHNSPINALAANASQVFTASNDHTVGIWRVASHEDSLER